MCHSSIVTLELRSSDQRVKLAQLAHEFAVTAEPCELRAGIAEILMTIDGASTLMRVRVDQQQLAKGARFRLHSADESETHSNNTGEPKQ